MKNLIGRAGIVLIVLAVLGCQGQQDTNQGVSPGAMGVDCRTCCGDDCASCCKGDCANCPKGICQGTKTD
jgi:hypothetical protein